ncbi:hypothetical protein B0H19DRAFT_1152620 [Mycena capillaripes]|nr:hypothetical protein B0H19DRAFT_1152620 [Mycena capillaripes]
MFSVFQVLWIALSLASSAAAQATTLPQCALGCAKTDAIKAGCDLSDTPCLCQTSFSANVIQCSHTTSCSQSEQAQVSAILAAMCGAVSTVSQSGSASASLPVSGSSNLPSHSSSAPASSGSVSTTASPASTTPLSSSTSPPSGPSSSNSSPSVSPSAGGAQGMSRTVSIQSLVVAAAVMGMGVWVV